MWTIAQIEELGFKLIANDKLWCHFRGHGFDVTINLDTKVVKGNHFNFHSLGANYGGHFRAVINTKEEFLLLMKLIQK